MADKEQSVQPAAANPATEPAAEKPQEAVNGAAPPSEEKKQTEQPTETPAADNVTQAAPAQSTDAPKEDAIEEQKGGSKTNEQAATEQKAAETTPADNRPEYLSKNPALSQLFDRLSSIKEKTGHDEMWGVSLKDSDDIPTVNVLIKFLRANEGNVKSAEEQLTKALEWRKKMDPLTIADKTSFNASKFKGLGYITTYNDPKGRKVVFTWNIYGVVKDVEKTFGDIDEFIKWRVSLMELAIRDLKLNEATSVIDYNGEDPYQMLQVHDYQNVSFLRLNPTIKNASRTTIEVFSTAYPELLKEKFFVNVPLVMGWVFTALKVFLSKNTIRKFHPITNGANLAREFSGLDDEFPKSYGGKGPELADNARTVSLQGDTADETSAAPAPAEKDAAPDTQAKTEDKAQESKPVDVSQPAEKAADDAPSDKLATPALTETPEAK